MVGPQTKRSGLLSTASETSSPQLLCGGAPRTDIFVRESRASYKNVFGFECIAVHSRPMGQRQKMRDRALPRGLFGVVEPHQLDHAVGSIELRRAGASLVALSISLWIIPAGRPIAEITYSG